MKKLISLFTIALIFMAMPSKAQDTVYFDVTNQMVVIDSNATNPNLYSQDSSKTDTLYTYSSGVQNLRAALTLYSETIPTTYNSYKVSFSMTFMAGAFDFSIDTNFNTLYNGTMINNQTKIDNIVTNTDLVLPSGTVLDFNISNTVNAGRYQVDIDIIHTVDTIFLTNITTGINDNSFNRESLSFNVYPNPTTDYLNVSNDVKVDRLEVYSMSGSLVKIGNLNSNTIDVSSLNRGTYILRLVTQDGKTSTKQFMKQ